MTTAPDPAAMGWAARRGESWAVLQPILDGMFAPLEALLTERAAAAAPSRVLDIGCGAGATALALAQRLGAPAQVTGVDISPALIALAQQRAAAAGLATQTQFITADAQRHGFAPASADAVVSRFGVMFFDDPVAAFANLHRATAPGGRLTFLAWRSAAENPFFTAAERAARPLLPPQPPADPTAPGQFAFADAGRVQAILTAAGWQDVVLEPADVPFTLSAADFDSYLRRMGNLGATVATLPPVEADAVLAAAAEGFAPFRSEQGFAAETALWLYSAAHS